MRVPAFTLALLGLAASVGAEGMVSPTTSGTGLQPQTIVEYREVPGTLVGTDTADLRAKVPGTVQALYVARGATVQKGQLLGVLKDTRTTGQLQPLTQQAEALKANLDRLVKLKETDAASQAEVDAATAAYAMAEGQRRATAESDAQGRIVAPMAGEVAVMNLVTGTAIMPGELLAQVATKPLRVRLDVPERHAALLTQGAEVPLMGLMASNQPHIGTVTTVYPSVAGGTATVMVSATGLTGHFIGQKVTALLSAGQHTGLLVPLSALTRRDGLTFATVKGEGKVVVQTGTPQPDGTVEVLSGLQPGDILE